MILTKTNSNDFVILDPNRLITKDSIKYSEIHKFLQISRVSYSKPRKEFVAVIGSTNPKHNLPILNKKIAENLFNIYNKEIDVITEIKENIIEIIPESSNEWWQYHLTEEQRKQYRNDLNCELLNSHIVKDLFDNRFNPTYKFTDNQLNSFLKDCTENEIKLFNLFLNFIKH